MKERLLEHALAIVFVTLALSGILWWTTSVKNNANNMELRARAKIALPSTIDLSSSFDKALLLDVTEIFYPGEADKNRALVRQIIEQREKELRDRVQRSTDSKSLSPQMIGSLTLMYAKFFFVYLLVMFGTWYGVQTMAVWRFCHERRTVSRFSAGNLAGSIGRFLASFILFCPAYVIAYSLKTELNTDTIVFLVLLCCISNGLLMVYTQKFYAFLVAESRRGYVEIAEVKNLDNDYNNGTGGIRLGEICALNKRFDGHVFGHIFRNARFQYMATIKEQSSFLITGMIITEMALNMHGYLSYEMLRQLLYRNYDIVTVIVLAIFLTVKLTEIVADLLVFFEQRRYANKH